MTRPRLLDLFCGAGGAAMGYHRAGFDVYGVDLAAQPRYPFVFIQGDALDFVRRNGEHFDAIHASPPCQTYANVTAWRGNQSDHPNLVGPTRDALEATGAAYVIENVPEAPIRRDFYLCGSQLGIRVRRHRAFEVNFPAPHLLSPCNHRSLLPFMHKGERAYADAMGCDWMSNIEARQAIPPAYTEFIGGHLMTHIEGRSAA